MAIINASGINRQAARLQRDRMNKVLDYLTKIFTNSNRLVDVADTAYYLQENHVYIADFKVADEYSSIIKDEEYAIILKRYSVRILLFPRSKMIRLYDREQYVHEIRGNMSYTTCLDFINRHPELLETLDQLVEELPCIVEDFFRKVEAL